MIEGNRLYFISVHECYSVFLCPRSVHLRKLGSATHTVKPFPRDYIPPQQY